MAIWKNSLMVSAFLDSARAFIDDPCQVRIDQKEIVVSYEDEDVDGIVVYKGKENGTGHFELFCPEVNGKATLHMFEGGNILEGYWQESGYEGFWRIKLID